MTTCTTDERVSEADAGRTDRLVIETLRRMTTDGLFDTIARYAGQTGYARFVATEAAALLESRLGVRVDVDDPDGRRFDGRDEDAERFDGMA